MEQREFEGRVNDLVAALEKRATEIEAVSDVVLPEEARPTTWHCASRAAGIRDAIFKIKTDLLRSGHGL